MCIRGPGIRQDMDKVKSTRICNATHAPPHLQKGILMYVSRYWVGENNELIVLEVLPELEQVLRLGPQVVLPAHVLYVEYSPTRHSQDSTEGERRKRTEET